MIHPTLTKEKENIQMPLLREFCELINQNNEPGDILEFGTGGGGSSDLIANKVDKSRKIFTFDGFQGLPETTKVIPQGTGWVKGAYFYDEEETRNSLKQHPNIIIEKTMTWELKTPSEYGIDKIVGVNLDLDLYEGTLDALRFMDKCSWNKLYLRFDDWGCYSFQVATEVDDHEKAAFFDWIKETNYQFEIDENLLNQAEGRQSIITVTR
jgi:hypothetical protein